MTRMIDRLTAEPDVAIDGNEVYDLAQIHAVADRVIDLGAGAVMAMAIDSEIVDFAVFGFSYGPTIQDGVSVGGVKLYLVLHGDGPAGELRELRHTYWGDEGYLFYPDVRVIVAAMAALKEWFDVE
jgi:hypothetical protein